MPDFALRLLVYTSMGGAESALSGLAKSLGPIGPAAAVAVGAIAAIGVAAVGVGAMATKMAADYQQGMNMVQALTGASDAQMSQYDAGLKKLAIDAGVAPTELTAGLYKILSANIPATAAMLALTLATKDAKIGMTDEATTAKALTTIINSFSVKTQDYTRVNGEMLQTVTLGDMTMQQYSASIGKAASTSDQFHVSMEDMNASIATLTAKGIPTAAQAVTDYDAAVIAMDGNIGTITKSLGKAGIAFNEAKFNTLDYTGKIKMLGAAVQEADDKHIHITGVTKQAAAALQILNAHTDTYMHDLGILSDQQTNAQKTAEAWAKTQSGFNQQMDRAKAALDVLMISIGQQLLPILTKFMEQMVPLIARFQQWIEQNHVVQQVMGAIIPILSGFIEGLLNTAIAISNVISFFQKNQVALDALKAILIATAIVVLPMLTAALIGMAVAAWLAAVPIIAMALPFIALGLVIAAFVFGVIELYQHWGAITDWISGKTEQLRIKNEQQHAQMAIDTDKQTAKGAASAIANLEKERVGLISKLGQTHDAMTRMELQHQLDMTNRDIAGQQARLKSADADAAAQKAKQAQLHADLLEAQKSWHQRFDDMANSFFAQQLGRLNGWRNQFDAGVRQWGADTMGTVNGWRNQFDAGFNQAFQSVLSTIGGWKDRAVAAVQQAVSGMLSTIAQLPGQMMAAGQNAIQGLINGIMSKIGGITSAMSSVASTIASFLPHSPAKTGPLSDPGLYGTGLINQFSKDLKSHSPQAHEAAQDMMSQITSAMKQYPLSIAEAQLEGNKTLKKSLEGQYADVRAQYAAYKALVKQDDYAYSARTGQINFNPVLKVGSGSGGSTGSSSGSSSSAANAGLIINNYINVYAQHADAKAIYDLILKNLTKDLQRSGALVTTTSGGRSR